MHLDTLRLHLVGVDPARAAVIAQLVASELCSLAPSLVASADGRTHVDTISVPAVPHGAGDTDGALAVRIAQGVVERARHQAREVIR